MSWECRFRVACHDSVISPIHSPQRFNRGLGCRKGILFYNTDCRMTVQPKQPNQLKKHPMFNTSKPKKKSGAAGRQVSGATVRKLFIAAACAAGALLGAHQASAQQIGDVFYIAMENHD